ncbi:MAG: dTDP-4-dehydrorhamnose reductase [Ruminococcus sp.]
MKVLVTGVAGQLGHDVMNELAKRGYNGIGSDIAPEYSGFEDGTAVVSMPYVPLDITDKAQVNKTIIDICPDVVVHCAAWTAVDAAEEPENRERVFSVNADGARNIAEACKDIDAKMIYISTDYVFGGSGTEPWKPDSQNYNPLNIYGESKLRGELAVRDILEKYFIVRIAWVFGVSGGNFVKTMLKLGKKFDTIRVVNDQIGTPTYTYDLARLLVDIAETDKYGCYHATNEGGYISWYDFACEIFKQAGYNTNIVPVSTEEYGVSKAARPFNSRLDKSKLTENGFRLLPVWQDALARYLKEIKGTTEYI